VLQLLLLVVSSRDVSIAALWSCCPPEFSTAAAEDGVPDKLATQIYQSRQCFGHPFRPRYQQND
jgi:hypothetical protein